MRWPSGAVRVTGWSQRASPKAPIKKDYVVVPDDLMGDLPGLKTWIAQSLTGL